MPLVANLNDALLLAVWRRPRHPQARMSGLGVVAALLGVTLVTLAIEFAFDGGGLAAFDPYGVESLATLTAADAALLAAFASADSSGATLRLLVLVYLDMAAFGYFEYFLLLAAWLFLPPSTDWTLPLVALAALKPLRFLWFAGAARQALRPCGIIRFPGLRAAALTAALALTVELIPRLPAFPPPFFDRSTANYWEAFRAQFGAAHGPHTR